MLELLVQTKTGTSNLASTVVTFDSNTVAGNSIIIVAGNSSTTAGDISGITDTQGNVYTKDNATANVTVGEIEIWHTSGIPGGANTITVAYTAGVACAVIAREYNGVVYANSLDKQTGTTGNSNTLNSGNTTALTQNNELLIGAGLIPLANSFSAGGNFVNLVSAGAPLVVAVAAEDLFVTNGGVQAASFGANASIQWVCCIASYYLLPTGTTTSTSSTSASTFSTSSTSSSTSSTSSSISSTSNSTSTSSTSYSMSVTTMSTSSTSSSISSTSSSSTSASTSQSSTSSSISSTSYSSTSQSSTSSSISVSSTSSSISSTSSSVSSTSASTSSTSFSSTSSSLSTSTTTVPAGLVYTYEDRAQFTQTQQFYKTSTWTCPANITTVQVECWAGGGGGGGNASTQAGGGGGGGQYARGNSVAVTAGTSYTITVGTGGTTGTSPTAGGDTWFKDTGTVLAKGGGAGASAGSGTPAGGSGAIAGSIGDVTFTGGTGGSGNFNSTLGGGGGGGAGNASNGQSGSAATAGGPAAAYGGKGTAGGSAGAPPGAFGGGGGGGDSFTSAGSGGQNGGVILTYTTTSPPPGTNTNLVNPFTVTQVGNASGDDGDYFIEYGSEYMIREYKAQNKNNTDNITFTWKGRSTQAASVSPILMQIYNVNSATWETVARETRVPADTDFSVTATQSANVSNYYDATNTVTFRSYQQVI